MDSWVLRGVNTLEKEDRQENISNPNQVKVKVSHLLVSYFDTLVYRGELKTRFPILPGRFAIGTVIETGTNCYGVNKGDRVYFESTLPCGECLACKTGKEENCADVKIAGKDINGYMRDFVVCDYTAVSVLPSDVSTYQALCIEHIALAEKIYDMLHLSAGSKVAVIGAGITGNIIAQIMQYHKLIPILIDTDEKRLEKARKAGMFYSFNADGDIVGDVMDATAGTLCDAVIFTTCANVPERLATKIVARNRSIILAGFSQLDFPIQSTDLLAKNLTFMGVNNGYGYTTTAINLIIHGAINIDYFAKKELSEFDPIEVFAERAATLSQSSPPNMLVLKMIF